MARKLKIVTLSDITKFGDSLAKSIRAHLRWSTKLRKQVRLKRATSRGEVTSIEITIAEGNADLAGMARAFEYGSGIHSTKGTRRKYRISPKNARALWFYMDNPHPSIPIYIKPSGEIGVTLSSVMHPGVAPRPFIGKAIASTLPKASPELRLAIKRNIVDFLKIELKGIGN